MCGIAGIWDFRDAVTPRTLERFAAALAHRGPDGHGTWYGNDGDGGGGGVALAHRRLAILDPTPAGHQPMHLGERYVMSYNGEVYNFLELRPELEALGHRFRGDSDSEVLLAAYAQWGPACLPRFNGMFAVAIYDRHARTLWLARDRYGIKPLYYLAEGTRRFAFASETIAFRALDGYERTFDPDNLRRCLAEVTALEPFGKTIYTDVRQVLAGHTITVTADGRHREERWWDRAADVPTLPTDPVARVREWRDRFDAACRLRMRSDVPLASAVSGGLDSSSVYTTVHHIQSGARAAERSPANWQRAYVLAFPGSARDETAYAEAVVAHVRGELSVVTPDFSDVDRLVARTRAFDTVFHNPNFILRDLYGAMAADGIKVSLDGHGADELMYGYPVMLQRALRIAAGRDLARYRTLGRALAAMDSVEALPAKVPWPHRPRALAAAARRYLRARRYGPPPAAAYRPVIDEYFTSGTLEAILRNFDRSSMAVGVEIRMPFLDHRLVSYTLALTVDDHVRGPYTKATLREAMSGRLPEPIRLRTNKLGLMAPLDELFAGQLRPLVSDIIHDSGFRQNPYWDGGRLARAAEEKLASGRWTLVDGLRLWPYLNAYLLQ